MAENQAGRTVKGVNAGRLTAPGRAGRDDLGLIVKLVICITVTSMVRRGAGPAPGRSA